MPGRQACAKEMSSFLLHIFTHTADGGGALTNSNYREGIFPLRTALRSKILQKQLQLQPKASSFTQYINIKG